MIALTLLARGLMSELPLKLGFGTGSVEYGQAVQRAAGSVIEAADDLQVPIGELNDRLAKLEQVVKLTTTMAAATAREVKEHNEDAEQPMKPLDSSGD
jgi:hypothetical protein